MKYILGVLGTILLLFLVVVFVFNRGGNSPDQKSNAPKAAQLVDYATRDSSVSLTVNGPVVSEDERRSVRITVSPIERRIEILSGYHDTVINSQTYSNTTAAYEAFLSALGGQGFTNSKTTKISDHRSVCPGGRHYIYELTEGNSTVSNLWSISCNREGTFNGRASAVRELFSRQIPDYSQQVAGVKL